MLSPGHVAVKATGISGGKCKTAPEPCQPDTSLVLNWVFSLQQQDSESIRTVAQDLKVYPAEIYDLVQGLLPGPVSM